MSRLASWLIGRESHCAVIVEHPEVSRNHCRLLRTAEGCYWVEDLHSANGTYVQGVRIQCPTLVTVGTTITLGPRVRLPWPPYLLQGDPPSLCQGTAPTRPATQCMLIRIDSIQTDEQGCLEMFFCEIDETGRIISGRHGPTSPLVEVEPARDAQGLVEDACVPDQVGIRLVTESGSQYFTVMNKGIANRLRIRVLQRSPLSLQKSWVG